MSELPSGHSEGSSPSSLHPHLRCGLYSVDGQLFGMLASEQRTLAAFILSITCSGYQIGQSECINEKLHLACGSLLQSLESQDINERKEAEKNVSSQFRLWLCICLGTLCKRNALVQSELFKAGIHFRLKLGSTLGFCHV